MPRRSRKSHFDLSWALEEKMNVSEEFGQQHLWSGSQRKYLYEGMWNISCVVSWRITCRSCTIFTEGAPWHMRQLGDLWSLFACHVWSTAFVQLSFWYLFRSPYHTHYAATINCMWCENFLGATFTPLHISRLFPTQTLCFWARHAEPVSVAWY